MTEPLKSQIHVFDPRREFAVVERRLPHWSQPGAITFITWRTWDSIPEQVLANWLAERDQWLVRHGVFQSSHLAPRDAAWRKALQQLDPKLLAEFHRLFSDRWGGYLDHCHGSCALRDPNLANIVAKSLKFFDGDRYELTDFVVMPNHVHILAAFPDEDSMLLQCDSWKHFTATKINRALKRSGRFWQQDGFDHLVRSIDQFEYLRRYVANNGRRADLQEGEYLHYSKQL